MTPIHHYQSAQHGIKLVITGAIHGNEKCGTLAIQRLIDDLETGRVTLRQGALTLIPICNPQAYELNTRFVDENLNRVFMPQENPQSYEQELANFLCPIVASCDALLDLHSIHTKGREFAMCFDPTPKDEADFIAAINMPFTIHGWSEAYARSFPQQNKGQDMHTAGYMRSQGKIAAGIECGQHDDPHAAEIAYTAIMRALCHFDLIDSTTLPHNILEQQETQAHHVMLDQVHLRQHEHDRLIRDFMHGDILHKGEPIVTMANGDVITASRDMLILFPRPACPVGEEFFYSGHFIHDAAKSNHTKTEKQTAYS